MAYRFCCHAREGLWAGHSTEAPRYGAGLKMVAKWRKRATVGGAPMGPKDRRSSALSKEEEVLIRHTFRRHTLLPLDDCASTRSSLHRCLQRQGISRLPDVEGSKPTAAFKACPIRLSPIPCDRAQLCGRRSHRLHRRTERAAAHSPAGTTVGRRSPVTRRICCQIHRFARSLASRSGIPMRRWSRGWSYGQSSRLSARSSAGLLTPAVSR